LRSLAVVAAALLACGCTRPIEQYCEAYYDALAQHDASCGASLDVAQTRWSWARSFYCPSATRLLSAGKISYDAAQGDACIARIQTSGCLATIPIGGPDPCALAIVGLLAVGEECYDGRECAPGTACGDTGCPSVCLKVPALGEACVGACQSGSWCAKSVCAAPAREGEACGPPEEPSCDDGLWCGALSKTCRSIGALTSGGKCEGPEDCALGYVCLGSTCSLAQATGDACVDGECSSEDFCDSGTCAPLPQIGEACDGTATCATGWCDSVSGKCSAFVLAGGACAPAAPSCAPFSSCDPKTATCLAQCAPP
jgi:hypothetical protein